MGAGGGGRGGNKSWVLIGKLKFGLIIIKKEKEERGEKKKEKRIREKVSETDGADKY